MGWSGKFTLKESDNKYTIAVSYLRLITFKNITIIPYKSYRRDKRTHAAKGGSGRSTYPGWLQLRAYSEGI